MKQTKRAKIEESPSKRPQVVIDLADDVSHISASPSESDTEVEEIINIRPQRPPQRSKPNSKGKGRDRPEFKTTGFTPFPKSCTAWYTSTFDTH
jgi:hypothetical protein